jgi:hypothetical protein
VSHRDAPGTLAGYTRHRDAREPACEACAAAWRVYQREWAAAHRPFRGVDPATAAAAVQGHRVRLSRAELAEAVRQLNAQRLTDPQIAVRLRVSAQTVLRHRKRLGIPPAVPPGHRTAA